MPQKMMKSPRKQGANKVASATVGRSIVARATKVVAKTRKAIGKVAGRPDRKAVAKPVSSRTAAPARATQAMPRKKAAQLAAGTARGARKATTKRSTAPKKTVAKKAATSRRTPRTVATRKAAPARPVGKAAPARKVAAVKKAVAAKKVAPPSKVAASKARPRVPGAKRSAKVAVAAVRTTPRAPGKVAARSAASRPVSTRPAPARPTPVRAPHRGYSEERFLSHQRNVLERERATYLEQASSLQAEAELLVTEMEPGDIQFDEESGEGGTVAVDRERDLTLSAQALEAVAEIEAALAKIENGSYGVCESCGELIPKLRLEALPYARLCMACKSGGLSRR